MSQSQQSGTFLSVTYKQGPFIERPITISKKVNNREDFRAEIYWESAANGLTALAVTPIFPNESYYGIHIILNYSETIPGWGDGV